MKKTTTEKYKKYIITILSIGWILLILLLSFQNGESTADTSSHFTKMVLQILTGKEPDYEVLMMWDARFRLAAHFVLFFFYELLLVAVWRQFNRRTWILLAGTGLGILLAVFTEVGKLAIEGRHCDFSEMGLNLAGVAAGVIFFSILCGLGRAFHSTR